MEDEAEEEALGTGREMVVGDGLVIACASFIIERIDIVFFPSFFLSYMPLAVGRALRIRILSRYRVEQGLPAGHLTT